MIKRIVAVLLVIAFVLVLTAACETGSDQANRQPGEPAKAMFITHALSVPAQAFTWSEFERLQGQFNLEMSVVSGENDVAAEIAAIDRAVNEGYDVILINPSNNTDIVPALTRAFEAGIYIGMIMLELRDEDQHIRHFFIGSDDFGGAIQAGQLVSSEFPDGANVVEIGGPAGTGPQIRLHDGFRAGLAENINVIDSENCTDGWNVDEAQVIMGNFLLTHGNAIEVVWCHWDDGATAVIEAVRAAGRDDIFIIGVGGNAAGYRQVMEGTQALSVGLSITSIAQRTLGHVRALLDGSQVPGVNIIPMDMVTSENVDSLPFPNW